MATGNNSNGLSQPPPLCTKGNACANWNKWINDFSIYMSAMGIDDKPGKRQVNFMLHCIGEDGREDFKTFNFTNAEDDPPNRKKNEEFTYVCEQFENYYSKKNRVRQARREFLGLQQQANEGVLQFINKLKVKVRECNYGDANQMVLDKICEGVRSEKIAERLCDADFGDAELTLDKAIEICRQVEMTEEQLKSRRGEQATGTSSFVNAVQRKCSRGSTRSFSRGRARATHTTQAVHASRAEKRQQPLLRQQPQHSMGSFSSSHGQRFRRSSHQQQLINCKNCNLEHEYGQCPAYGTQCFQCGQMNHWSRCCSNSVDRRREPNRGRYHGRGGGISRFSRGRGNFQNANVHTVMNDVDEIDCEIVDAYDVDENYEDFFVYAIENVRSNEKREMWNVTLDVVVNSEYHAINCKIDTQAQVNVLNSSTVEQLGLLLEPTNVAIRPFRGEFVRPLGQVCLNCYYKGQQYLIVFQVVDGRVPNLLGDSDSLRLGLVKRVYSLESEKIVDQYADVFQGLGTIPGFYHIETDSNVNPVVHPPRKVPVAIRFKVKAELDKLESQGIIKKESQPTDWVSSLLAVTKGDKVRICIDPKDLNVAIKRSHYPLTTIEDVITRTEGSKIFGTLDCSQGFFQIALDQESSKLTTFNTPWGRYRYLKLPMGLSCSPEIYQMAMVDMFGDLEGVEIIMDDVLIHAPDSRTFEKRLDAVLMRCRKFNLRLNPRKTRLGLSEVDWIGHKITDQGVKISEKKVQAIVDMPQPKSVDEVRRFMGMITYLSKFIPNMSDLTAPIRILLKKDVVFHWDSAQEEAFRKCKRVLMEAPVLRYYSSKEPVTLSCDASSTGLGVVVLQRGHPVAYASKALSECEQRYAQIEKEMLGIVFACHYFHYLIYGRDQVIVETDHKPLETIWKKPLINAPMRLQKMLLRLQPYSLEIRYKKGTDIPIPDALSRLYCSSVEPKLIDDSAMVSVVETCFSDHRETELRQAVKNDSVMQALSYIIRTGWPEEKSQVPDNVKIFWDFRDELVVDESGLVFRGQRIVIPAAMRSRMLDIIHQAHLGIVKCKKRARDVLFWPGMNKQIEEVVSKCSTCQENRNQQQREPLVPTEVPDREWKKVAIDLFDFDNSPHVVMVDYFSEYFEVGKLQDTRSVTIIEWVKQNFARFGIPEELVSDGASYFTSREFQEFTHTWQVRHLFSSPTHSQSNGMAEKAVGICKKLLAKAQAEGRDPYLALLDNRNVPRDHILGSPVQRMLHRRTRTLLPTSSALLKPRILDQLLVREQLQKLRKTQKYYYDRGTKPLKPLSEGNFARIQTETGWKPGLVVKVGPEPRSYKVVTEQGRTLRRNRKHLLQTPEDPNDFTMSQVNRPRSSNVQGTTNSNSVPVVAKPAPPPTNRDSPIIVRRPSVQPDSALISPTLRQKSLASPNAPKDPPWKLPSTTPPFRLRSGRISKPPDKFKDYVLT